MENSRIILGYMIYLPIAIVLTIYVSKMLFKNGKLFMIEIFKGKEDIAMATNRLFEMGFYLINIGWALLILKISVSSRVTEISYQSLIEKLSLKIGAFSIYLGIMLMLNLFFFLRGRRKARQQMRKQTPQIIIQNSELENPES